MALAVIAVQAWLVLELLRRHGMLVMRVDRLEDGSGDTLMAHPWSPAGAAALALESNGGGQAAGLPVGTVAPEIDLPQLDGRRGSLSALRARGRQVLLIFTDPQCGPCQAILPDVARWQHNLEDGVTIAVVTRGSEASNRANAAEHGLQLVLLQEDREGSSAYNAHATPSAVLVDPDGMIASDLAVGALAITSLA
ncbi:MAG: redoxin domain-containing protein [Solirubrobacterales bacterium]|nr:redoxin domain-containing protein [Solirubrobacterales bacterium]